MNDVPAQLVLPLTPADHSSFATFWVGSHGELVDALRNSVLNRQKSSLIFFYGAAGAGKSHLLYATAQLAKQHAVGLQYLALAEPQSTTAWVESLSGRELTCLDDIHAWAGDSVKERALFSLFERIRTAGGQLIVSSGQAPDNSGFVMADLVSRLSSGLLYPLQTLDDEQQYQALQMRARQKGLSITPKVLQYLMRKSTRDAACRFALLDRIDQASLVAKRRITIPFIKSLLD